MVGIAGYSIITDNFLTMAIGGGFGRRVPQQRFSCFYGKFFTQTYQQICCDSRGVLRVHQVAKDVQLPMNLYFMCSGTALTQGKCGIAVASDHLPPFSHKHVRRCGSVSRLKNVMNAFFLQGFGGYGVGGTIWCLGMRVETHTM